MRLLCCCCILSCFCAPNSAFYGIRQTNGDQCWVRIEEMNATLLYQILLKIRAENGNGGPAVKFDRTGTAPPSVEVSHHWYVRRSVVLIAANFELERPSAVEP